MIEGQQHKNISFDKGIIRTPSMGADGELSECVNLIPYAGEMSLIQEPTPLVDGAKWLLYTCLYSAESGVFTLVLSAPTPASIGFTIFLSDPGGNERTVYIRIDPGESEVSRQIEDHAQVTVKRVVVNDSGAISALQANGFDGLRVYNPFVYEDASLVQFPEEGMLPFRLPENHFLVCTHLCDGKDNYILNHNNKRLVCFRVGKGYTVLFDSLIAGFAVDMLGQTLILTQNTEKRYYVWDEDGYREQNVMNASVEAKLTLGDAMPYITNAADFSGETGSISGHSFQVHVSYGYLKKTGEGADFDRVNGTIPEGDVKPESWTWQSRAERPYEVSDLLSLAYATGRGARREEGAACYPFYVRYGVELYDGSLINLSAPILMTPSTIVKPQIGCYVPDALSADSMSKSDSGSGLSEAFTLTPILTARYFYAAFDAQNLRGLSKDLIKGISVYVTREIEMTSGSLANPTDSFTFYRTGFMSDGLGSLVNSLSAQTGDENAPKPAFINYVYTYPDAELRTEEAYNEITDPVNFYRLALIPYSFLESSGFKVFMRIGNGCFRVSDTAEDWEGGEYTAEDGEHAALVNAEYTPYEVPRSSWEYVTSQASLSSSMKSQRGMSVVDANSTYNYNSRLIYGGFVERMSTAFSVSSFLGDSRRPELRGGSEFTMYVQGEGTSKTLVAHDGYLRGYKGETFAVFSPYSELTGLAYEAGISQGNKGQIGFTDKSTDSVGGYTMYTSLTREDLLKDDLKECFAFQYQTEITDDWKENNMHENTAKGRKPNSVALTRVSNPWVIETVCELACGEILALSSATEAVSEGQFGEFPVYAFTDNGIYALSVSATGTVEAKQPISREVISAKNAVLQLDNAVVFPTKAGLCLLSGRTVTPISDALRGFNVDESLYDAPQELTIPDKQSFATQVQDCRMLYDAVHRRIHVFNDKEAAAAGEEAEPRWTEILSLDYTLPQDVTQWFTPSFSHSVEHEITRKQKHYVYDIVSGQWAAQILPSRLIKVVPGYPFSVMQFANTLYNYSAEEDPAIVGHGWLLTRPIAFGDIFTRKMLADLRVFGQKVSDEASFKVQVYTSEDRTHWHRLSSLKSRSAKWYRFLVKADMSCQDTLSGMACQYAPRFGQKFR